MAYTKIESHDEYLEVVEKYKDYEAGTYQSMTLEEKMDFFDGIHTDHVPLWDEDGDEMDTSDDYDAIRDEFLEHPEQFTLDNILDFIEMLDDDCYQPSFMDTIIKIIHNIVCYYQLEGVTYLLSHLHEVPSRGYVFGLFSNVRYLINDDSVYPLVKEALAQITPHDRKFVLQILKGTDMPKVLGIDHENRKFPILSECGNEIELGRKAELEDIISRLPN
ncbi:MAG: hypothetical protein K2O91_19125 [Lachnospiraceae bacterium]|nr:hypothetical protein [Lachnospiraceae bacterium]